MNSRSLSIIKSLSTNGVLQTINLLTKMFLFKVGLIPSIKLKKFGPLHLRRNTSDLPVFRHIFLDCEYGFFRGSNEPKVILDAGANIGLFTRYVNPIFPNSTFICIEPESENFEVLKKNTQGLNNIILLKKALWINNDGVQLHSNPEYGEWGTSVTHATEGSNKTASITMKSLLEEFSLEQIDILKIDIEGAEESIFTGDISWLQKVQTIVIELHDFMSKGSSNSFLKSLEMMQPYNFSVEGENVIIKRI